MMAWRLDRTRGEHVWGTTQYVALTIIAVISLAVGIVLTPDLLRRRKEHRSAKSSSAPASGPQSSPTSLLARRWQEDYQTEHPRVSRRIVGSFVLNLVILLLALWTLTGV